MPAKSRGYVFLLIAFALFFFGVSASEEYVKVLKGTGIGLYYPYFYLWLQFANFFAAGMAFGMEKFISERKQPGRWKVNPARLIILGIPSLLMGAYLILWSIFPIIPSLLSLFLADIGLFVNLMQMLFGYTVATSFYKAEQGGVAP